MALRSCIIKNNTYLNKLEIAYSQTTIYQKRVEEPLEIHTHHYKKNSHMFVSGSKDAHASKTYYIIQGKCKHLETSTILTEGDILAITELNEVENLYMIEDTVFLVHSFNTNTYRHVEEKTRNLKAVLAAIQAKDAYTEAHCSRVFSLTHRMALACGYTGNKMYNILRAARYHDIGKIFIDSAILNKPGRLNHEEYEIMKTHTILGQELIVDQLCDEIVKIVSQHHERIDGSGYPQGLKGEEICEASKILAICDSYDAMVVDRVYQVGKTKFEALAELKDLAGIKYDLNMVNLFIELMNEEEIYHRYT